VVRSYPTRGPLGSALAIAFLDKYFRERDTLLSPYTWTACLREVGSSLASVVMMMSSGLARCAASFVRMWVKSALLLGSL
jgi:acetoin utilization deacetylase AcuC-like enzyme